MTDKANIMNQLGIMIEKHRYCNKTHFVGIDHKDTVQFFCGQNTYKKVLFKLSKLQMQEGLTQKEFSKAADLILNAKKEIHENLSKLQVAV